MDKVIAKIEHQKVILRKLAPRYKGKPKGIQLKWKEEFHPPSTLLCITKRDYKRGKIDKN